RPSGGQRVDWSFQTAARAKPVRPEIDIASDVSSPELLLVAAHLVQRGGLAAQAVVEELLPLGTAELGGQQRALVDRAVEVDVAGDVPGDALVDRDVAVRLGADEVRAPEAPDPEATGDQDENQQQGDEDDAAPDRMLLALAAPPRGLDGRNRIELVERVVLARFSVCFLLGRRQRDGPLTGILFCLELEEDDGDVVFAAALVRGAHEGLRGRAK